METDKIKKLLELKDTQIKKEHLPFYYLSSERFCCDLEPKPLFPKVPRFSYLSPIEELSKYYQDSEPNFYKNLLRKATALGVKAPLSWTQFDPVWDEVMLHYVKCFPKLRLLLLWPTFKFSGRMEDSSFYELLKKKGKIHGHKRMYIDKKQLQSLLFQIYGTEPRMKTIEELKTESESLGKDLSAPLYVIFFEPKEEKLELKEELRASLKKETGATVPLSSLLFLASSFLQTIEGTQLLCNQTSMDFMKLQRMDRFFRILDRKSLIYLFSYKKWLLEQIHPVDQIRFMVFSSFVLFALGSRASHDVDLILHHLPETKILTKDWMDKILFYLEDEETRFPFADYHMKGRLGWIEGGSQEYLLEWFEKEWPASYGASSMQETLLDPRFHFYFLGVKIICFKGDLQRRLHRCRPAAMADLIALQIFYKIPFEIPPLPETFWKNHVEYEFTDSKVKELLRITQFYLSKRYRLKLSIEELAKQIKKKDK